MSKTSLKPIGQVLQEAGLVSATQVEIALQEQTALCGHPQAHVLQGAPHFPGGDLQETAGAGERMTQFNQTRLGEILARRGWLKQETADFFAEQWPTLLSQTKQPLGQYFKEAALLNKVQIEAILSEQRQTGLKFGELAVQKGWLKRITLDFF